MTAAEVLAKHRYGKSACDGCCKSYGYPDRHAAHQIDALRAAGYAVVELPKPQPRWDGELQAWPVEQTWHGDPDRPGDVSIRKSDGRIGVSEVSIPCEPVGARSLAAALLAAAAEVS